MATAEGKPEGKEEPKPQTKPESKEVEENQEPPLKYKAWVLKVSIHCEGCKRKVEKILRNIEGVYEAYADLKQQKATVKANVHVNAETLIGKLVKKGRHAELWPEKSEPKEKKQGKPKNKDKQGGQSEEAKGKETVKNEVSVHQDDGPKSSENGGSSKVAEAKQNVTRDQGGEVKEPKPEVKQNVTGAAGNQSPVAEKKKSDGGDNGGAGGESEGNAAEKSGSGSNKNKKKGQKGNASVTDGDPHHGDATPATVGSQFKGHGPHGPVPMPSPSNHSPPRHHPMYEYPTYYHAPPVYLTSYNTAYPSSSYSASYYASGQPYSYAYMHPGHTSELPTSDTDTYTPYPSYSSHPSDSFEMFSDENPNACSIM
ncbi:hypothetical protein GQ457_02G036320 [Hibiscus cannabinus]